MPSEICPAEDRADAQCLALAVKGGGGGSYARYMPMLASELNVGFRKPNGEYQRGIARRF